MIIFSCVFFAVYWKFLDKKVFQPFLNLTEAREAATTGASEEALAIIEKADQVKSEYEEKLLVARKTAFELKQENAEKTKLEAAEIIAKAEQEAVEILKNSNKEMISSINKTKEELAGKAEALAEDIVAKVQEAPLCA